MKKSSIQYCSDLHLEFPENAAFIKRNPIQREAEILVLSGDIVPLKWKDKFDDFFNFVSDNFEKTYWIPGNHEYYHFDLFDKSGKLHESIKSNVFLVNNTSVIHDEKKLIFSTLWSKIREANKWVIEKTMNDFQLIHYKGFRFSAEQYNQLYDESIAFIQDEVKAAHSEKVLVFTHHCPTLMNYPPQYKGNNLNDAFATEHFEFIETSNIHAWVYGHTHCNTPEFKISNTRMLTNQLGYIEYDEQFGFRTNALIY